MHTRFTFGYALHFGPIWSPDGSRIIFNSNQKGHYDLYVKPANLSEPEQPILVSDSEKQPADWSRDGKFLLYVNSRIAGDVTSGPVARGDLWALPLTRGKPFLFLSGSGALIGPARFSPDGRWVAYESNASGSSQVYITSFPEHRGIWEVSTEGGAFPVWGPAGKELFFLNQSMELRRVDHVAVHPGYKKPLRELQEGDAAPLIAFLANSDDIALIKLQQPVTDVTPVRCYGGTDETGRVVAIIGAGATGSGMVGEYPRSPNRGEFRRAEARVTSANDRWLTLRFNAPPKALPHEGMPADGDSGAPVLMRLHGTWELVGLVSHKYASGELKTFRCCVYGQITYQVRVSQYIGWIDAAIHRK